MENTVALHPCLVSHYGISLPDAMAAVQLSRNDHLHLPGHLRQAYDMWPFYLQKFNPIFRRRKGVCQARSVIVNIPANRVQQEIDNRSDDIDPVDLLRVFPTQKIDFLRYEGMLNESCHEEHPLYFSER